MSRVITFIGAGSVGFTRAIFSDIMSVPELRDSDFRFMDINPKNLDMVYQLCKRDIDGNGLDIDIKTTVDRREALKDANYVINAVRVGGLEAFESDIDIPLKYGVDQCVGDTICAGGIMYGQRGINVILDFCKDIREVAAEGCLLLNYANPNAMMTWAANKYGKVRTLGLCHGVHGGLAQIAGVLGVPVEELDYVCAGINHQTWYTSLSHKGRKISGEELLEIYENNDTLPITEKVRIDVLRNFGYYSTESNGHLSEYLAWYRKRRDEIEKWIDTGVWINGETGGYLRVTSEGRNWFEIDFPNWLKEPAKMYSPENRGHEHGSYIIEALETGRCYRGCFNVMNDGYITNLPREAVVEIPVYADGNGLNIPVVGDLPLGCAAICSQSVWVQRLAVEAAVTGDIKLLIQALLMDPLTGAVCNPPEIRQMADELIIAQAQWLPQYAEEIEKAKNRIASSKADGSYIPVQEGYRGAVRFDVKSADEMRTNIEEAVKNASQADKA